MTPIIIYKLARELFGQATSMVRIDGSEYSEKHSVSRLVSHVFIPSEQEQEKGLLDTFLVPRSVLLPDM